jgi:hypothetical protein
MPIVSYVHTVGIAKLRGIEVGGAGRRHDHGAPPDGVAIELDVRARDACAALDGAVVAQALLHRARGQRRVRTQTPETRSRSVVILRRWDDAGPGPAA